MAKMEDIVSLCKRRGFIFPGSDVYGGIHGKDEVSGSSPEDGSI